jgi:hypothetical protein
MKSRVLLRWAVILTFLAASIQAPLAAGRSNPPSPATPQEAGIASKYLGDEGIENDPEVVFVENFEEGSLPSVKARWEDVVDNGVLSLNADIPPGSAGTRSLLMAHTGGQGTGGHFYRRLLPGYDQLYLRFYVKFDANTYDIHHFVHMGGYNPSTPWPQGGAGERPDGTDRFTTGVEPFGPAWRWDFYTYWMHMRGNPGDNNYWGNDFINDANLQVVRDEWICVELMMKMNDPLTAYNGEQALWINGQPWTKDGQIVSHLGPGFPNGSWVWDNFIPDPGGSPFEGYQWRTTSGLNLNFIWLLLYITDAPAGHVSQVWFDNVVVARSYIGPMGTQSLELQGTAGNQAIHLDWSINGTLPITTTWQVAYDGPQGDQPSPITGILGEVRDYSLTGLTNYNWYTVTLSTDPARVTDTVKVMPTDRFIHLPLIAR